MLFSHWCQCPELLTKIQDKLNIVHAMIPDKEPNRKMRFLENSYLLFSETIYEQSDPAQFNPDEEEPYSYDQNDQQAPHYPVCVSWNPRLSEFSFQSFELEYGAIETVYKPVVEKLQQIMQRRESGE